MTVKSSRNPYTRKNDFKRNLWSGILFGIGFAAFVDETIFHQLLRWHHFYDRSTTAAGLISDGFFHAFSYFATVASLFLVADLRRKNAYLPLKWTGGSFLGAGLFNLYDGLIQHKIMRIHQIRYDVDLLLYDITWNAAAALFILIGIVLLMRSRKEGKHDPHAS